VPLNVSNSPTRKSIGGGVYVDSEGAFWARPWINHRRTWRKLKATKRAFAFKERAREPWTLNAGTFLQLANLYKDAGCPNRRLEPRSESFCAPERARLDWLVKYFGPVAASTIRLANLPAYAKWRKPRVKKGSGERTIDLELTTFSNVLSYGVAAGQLEINYVRSGRPRYRRDADVRRSRQVAPASADVIHRMADYFFDDVRSEALGWQLLFAMFTAGRTSELLRMRADAKPGQPGHIAGDVLSVHRSKNGVNPVNPFVIIGPEFREMLACHRYWLRTRHRTSRYYFPGRGGIGTLDRHALAHALPRASKALGLPKVTPHGVRSFYVTKRRSDGASDVQIAGEIGDKTSALMETTYGARPANWQGGDAMSWLPHKGLPAWARWRGKSHSIAEKWTTRWTTGRLSER